MPAMLHVKSRITIGRMQTRESEFVAFRRSPICFAESPLLHLELRDRHVPAMPGESRFAQPEVPLPISNRVDENPLIANRDGRIGDSHPTIRRSKVCAGLQHEAVPC